MSLAMDRLSDPHHIAAVTQSKRQYRLQDMKTGEFVLFVDLDKRTRNPKQAYIATEKQILNAQAKHPNCRGLTLELMRP